MTPSASDAADAADAAGTTGSTITITIAEDHQVVGDALALMLSFEPSFEVIGVARSGSEVVDLVERRPPHIVLMDVSLDGSDMDGIEATRRILDAQPDARILILSMHDDQDTVTRAIAAGAVGFLPKNVDRAELVRALQAVAAGGGFLHPTIAGPFLARVGRLADQSLELDRLTGRERGVLEHLAEGKSTREIAAALVVSEETVKSHLARIYQKLGVNDRVQAVATAFRRGLVQ